MAGDRSDISSLQQTFHDHANDYERRVGGATRDIAAYFVPRLSIPSNSMVIDIGCGTGAATGEILKESSDAHVYAVDVSKGMIDIVQSKIQERQEWAKQVETAVMDGQKLGYENDYFDISITNFGIFFYPDPEKGAREIYRTLKKGGTAVVTCWKEPGLVDLLYECQNIIKPTKPIAAMPVFDKWRDKAVMQKCMESSGFAHVDLEVKEVMMGGENDNGTHHGAIEMLKGMIGDHWSDEEKGKLPIAIRTLSKAQEHKFFVEENGMEGVRLVAWIAVAQK